MINEIQRDQFMTAAQGLAKERCLALAVVARDAADEPEVLEGWAALKKGLNGAGARIGYRAFLAVLRDTEAELRSVVTTFSDQKPVHAFWRFVAAPISTPEDTLAVLREIEWRAHKDVQYQTPPSLKVIMVASAL
jgi:hypothetical protein